MNRIHRIVSAVGGMSLAAALLMPSIMATPGTSLAASAVDKAPAPVVMTPAKPSFAGGNGAACLVLLDIPVKGDVEDSKNNLWFVTGTAVHCDGQELTVFINGIPAERFTGIGDETNFHAVQRANKSDEGQLHASVTANSSVLANQVFDLDDLDELD